MDELDGTAELLRNEHTGLWRALLVTSASNAAATDSLTSAAARLVQGEIPTTRVALWAAAFGSLSESEPAVGFEVIADMPIVELSDRLATLSAADVRMLLGHHLGRFDAGELVMFAADVAQPAGQAEDTSPVLERAEAALRRIDDRPVALQFAPVVNVDPPDLMPTRPRPSHRRLIVAAAAVAVGCGAVLSLGVGRVSEDPVAGDEAAAPPTTDEALVSLPTPASCGTDGLRRGVQPSPSALRAASGGSISDVVESTEVVLAGRLRSLRSADGWVTFDVGDVRLVDGADPMTEVAAFSMPGRLPAAIDLGDGVDFVAFVADDPDAPAGWRAPVRGGVWVACWGDQAVPLGDDQPSAWLVDPTLGRIGAVVDEDRNERQRVTFQRVDDRSVAGVVRLRDGTRLAIRLPSVVGDVAMEDVTLDVATFGRDQVVVSGDGVRATIDPSEGAIQLAAEDSPGTDPPGETELHIVARGEPTAGTIVRATPSDGVVALDAATLLPRWRLDDVTVRPVGLAGDVAAVVIGDELAGLDLADGAKRWTVPGAGSALITPLGDTWLLLDDGPSPSISAVDPVTGTVPWRLDGPAGVRWGSVARAGDLVVVAERWDDRGAVVAIDLATGDRRWSVDLGAAGAAGPRFEVDAERAFAVALDTDDRLVRIDVHDGAVTWRTMPLREPSITGIWPNSVTLDSRGRTITVGSTAGFLLPP